MHMSVFSLRDPVQGTVYEMPHDSLAYVRMFGIAGMVTFIPDEELGDWDFFVGAERAIDELRNIADQGCAARLPGRFNRCAVAPRATPRYAPWSRRP